jgi:hypothetical protein
VHQNVRKLVGATLAVLLLVGLSACRWRPPAATVNGHEITEQDLQDDIATLRESPELAALIYPASGFSGDDSTVPSSVTADVLTGRILEQLVADGYARSGKQLSAQDDAAQREALTADLLQALGGSQETMDRLPDDYVERLVTRAVSVTAMTRELAQEDVAAAMRSMLAQGEVTVDPRYGTWDPEALAVVPNRAPGDRPDAPDDSDGASTGAGSEER